MPILLPTAGFTSAKRPRRSARSSMTSTAARARPAACRCWRGVRPRQLRRRAAHRSRRSPQLPLQRSSRPRPWHCPLPRCAPSAALRRRPCGEPRDVSQCGQRCTSSGFSSLPTAACHSPHRHPCLDCWVLLTAAPFTQLTPAEHQTCKWPRAQAGLQRPDDVQQMWVTQQSTGQAVMLSLLRHAPALSGQLAPPRGEAAQQADRVALANFLASLFGIR